MKEVRISRDDAGQRLDRFLRKCLPTATLGHVFKLVRKGRVRVNGRKAKPEVRLQEGDVVALDVSADLLGNLEEKDRGAGPAPRIRGRGELRVLLRDEHVMAVDKPPFLLVQPGARADEPTLGDLVRAAVGPSGALTFEPALAHRLDRGTSGVVLFGLTAQGLRGLTRAFRARRVVKRYLALVEGLPDRDAFEVDEPLLRESAGEGQGARVRVSSAPEAQEARTSVTVLARGERFALVEARPHTGRTHQIRVHLRAAGLPIVGDPTYGRPATNQAARAGCGIRRPFLHAAAVDLEHPVTTGQRIRVESPLPDDLRRALSWAGIPVAAARPGREDDGDADL